MFCIAAHTIGDATTTSIHQHSTACWMPFRPSRKQQTPTHIAILTFEGFNELDSLIALGVLNRVRDAGWRVSIASPTERVRSMNGVVIESHVSLEEAAGADAVIVGSGLRTREVVADADLMARLKLDPSRQLLGAQCSGTLVLAKLGLLDGAPACTDLTTKPWVKAAGVEADRAPRGRRTNYRYSLRQSTEVSQWAVPVWTPLDGGTTARLGSPRSCSHSSVVQRRHRRQPHQR
jgi:putative intracellular protease/amidase